MSELEQFIEMKKSQKRAITESTMKKYIGFYNTLSKHLGDRKIADVSEEEIISIIDKLDISPAGKLNYQNLVTMIKDQHKQSTDKLVKFKEELSNMKDTNTKHKVVQKLITLPTYKQVRDYIDDLYEQADYSRYLVNELIFSYGLRNVDVNLYITDLADYKTVKKAGHDLFEYENWLVLKKSTCELVINRYKTSKSYGTKIIPIKNKKIFEAGNKLKFGWLIQSMKSKKVKDDNVHNYLNLMIYNGIKLRESDYFKINILHLQSQPNALHKINELGKTRGTQCLDTLDKYYNIHPKEDEDN